MGQTLLGLGIRVCGIRCRKAGEKSRGIAACGLQLPLARARRSRALLRDERPAPKDEAIERASMAFRASSSLAISTEAKNRRRRPFSRSMMTCKASTTWPCGANSSSRSSARRLPGQVANVDVLRHLSFVAAVVRKRGKRILRHTAANFRDALASFPHYTTIESCATNATEPLSPCTQGERGWGEGVATHGVQPPHPRPLSP